MREYRTYGSVRGAVSDDRPYRNPPICKMVTALDGFDDDPDASNEAKLEAIQMAWYEEWKDNQ